MAEMAAVTLVKDVLPLLTGTFAAIKAVYTPISNYSDFS